MSRKSVVYAAKLESDRQYSTLVNEAKIFDNHSLIDATSMVYERGEPEYQPLRKQMVCCLEKQNTPNYELANHTSAVLYWIP